MREQPLQVTLEENPVAPSPKRKQILPPVFVVVDLETTGLSCDSHEIFEIGAVRVVLDAQEHETYQVLVKPQTQGLEVDHGSDWDYTGND